MMSRISRSSARIALVAGDVALEPDVFLRQLVGLQAGEPLELHGEDRVGLHPGQARSTALASGSFRARRRISAETSMPISRVRASGGLADERITRMISSMYASAIKQPLDDVGPLPRLAELVLRPPPDHVDPVLDEQPEQVLQRQRLGPAVDQGQHDHAEACPGAASTRRAG